MESEAPEPAPPEPTPTPTPDEQASVTDNPVSEPSVAAETPVPQPNAQKLPKAGAGTPKNTSVIIATVIIVLGLAVLAVFAYLKTNSK